MGGRTELNQIQELTNMKAISQMTLGFLATIILASANAMASPDSTPIFLSVTSPDHPSTWVVGAHRERKALRWDSSRHILVADVKYSTQDYADSANPTQTDDHTLAFPNVHLASNGTDLISTNRDGDSARIGQIKNGLFGKEVVLRNGVNLNVHRVDGRIHASLVYDAQVKN
jgi:hypothetical protein